ncbi:MAG: hypothetical protein KJ728_03090 [Alphaproteobacteria bacterium]|uniref:hypothetical protein n=1 Tax=Brevundimonas sp. TaxID=1871086 RepID=UPI001D7C51D7|nr:hypothetical protein [Alphaproteobacteria bacterium]MBU1520390.1 hypothetical protein [Alphaproteobacteria bacterium]MBU2029824.1 hypothetical protein [Alphaproteobacteria bacterium]MBU2164650.1 hypothetical protein [Alphaproteobacteria bacterium]MBU2231449.1 hypothetical protein [Alphaproteobacteria bacterium]
MSTITSMTAAASVAPPRGSVDATFKSLVDLLNDDSGAVSGAAKATALTEIRKTWLSLGSASQATREYVDRGLSSSSFVVKSNALYNSINQNLSPQSGDGVRKSSENFQARMNAFDQLSDEEKIMFASAGSSTPEDWRATTEAQIKMHKQIEAARESGELGLDGKPTGKASAALSLLIEASDNFDKLDKTDKAALNAWTRSVNEMSDRPSAVRIDLSDDAKAYLNRK